MQFRIFILAFTVILQFLLELTIGRIFIAPSLIPLVLIYFSVNYESLWAIDGAFWSGIVLDLLMHQPPGSSSLAFLLGLFAARAFSKLSSGEGRSYILSVMAIAVLVSDTVFVLVASRPIGSGFSSVLLIVVPRMIISVIIGALLLSVISWINGIRSRNVTGRLHVQV